MWMTSRLFIMTVQNLDFFCSPCIGMMIYFFEYDVEYPVVLNVVESSDTLLFTDSGVIGTLLVTSSPDTPLFQVPCLPAPSVP